MFKLNLANSINKLLISKVFLLKSKSSLISVFRYPIDFQTNLRILYLIIYYILYIIPCTIFFLLFPLSIKMIPYRDTITPWRYFINVFIRSGFTNVSCVIFSSTLFFFRRKSVLPPYNRYLVAVYECIEGYVFEDSTTDRLFCSDGAWLGAIPRCVKVEGNMGMREERRYLSKYLFQGLETI